MQEIAANLVAVRQRIHAACLRAGRSPDTVELIAVSKTLPAEAVRVACEAGQTHFAESRLQEALPKIDALSGNLHWHFIGRVQRNKVRKLLPSFEVIHAMDSLRLATYADEIAAELGLFPKLMLQVNVADEASKGGFEPAQLRSEMDALLRLKRLDFLGLMAIPPAAPDAESARHWFVRVRDLRDSLEREFGLSLPALSMGMSGDYEVAVEEGATHVRVGSAIFGQRAYQVDGEIG